MSGFKPAPYQSFKPSKGLKANLKPLRTLPPAEDPLAATPFTGDLEIDTKAQLTDLEKAYRARMKTEAERFQAATETAFYFCAVFDSNAQCDTFLKATGLDEGQSDLFVDGRVLAKLMGIALPEPVIKFDREFKIDKKLLALTMKDDGK